MNLKPIKKLSVQYKLEQDNMAKTMAKNEKD